MSRTPAAAARMLDGIGHVQPVRDETARLDAFPDGEYRWQPAPERELVEPRPVYQKRRAAGDQKSIRPLLHHGSERAVEVLRTSRLHVLELNAQRLGGRF